MLRSTNNNTNAGGGSSSSGGGGGGADADMITQEDTIFVAGMNTDTTEEEIAAYFGAIGIIKVSLVMVVFVARF